MFEDLPRNLVVPHQIGMRTVLLLPTGTREIYKESWESEGEHAQHIEFTTDHLGGFLGQILGALKY